MGLGVRLLLTGAIGSITLACSDSPTQPLVEPCPVETLTAEASAGSAPIFTWSPECGVAFLEVYPAAGGPARWTVYAKSGTGPSNPIRSGVRYGITPPQGMTVAGPARLDEGIAYRMRVSRMLCDQGELCILRDAGEVTFQP